VQKIESSRIKVSGLDIHYLTCGEGDPLIIIHGGSDGAKAWTHNISILARNYKVYVPDMPGFGSSQEVEGKDYYIPEMVQFVDEFAHELGLKNFYLMGHSLGGGIALNYTLRFPDKINKLVLVSSLCLGREIAWWIRMVSPPYLSRPIGKAVSAVMKAAKWAVRLFGPWDIIQPFTQSSIRLGSLVANFTEQSIVLLGDLPQVMVPTLVIWGAKDPVVPFTQAYAAAGLIPDCQVKVFQDCGHSVYREKLREFSKLLSGFLG
jgi:pimeloyl-ACP methyl ester carboxylesterase